MFKIFRGQSYHSTKTQHYIVLKARPWKKTGWLADLLMQYGFFHLYVITSTMAQLHKDRKSLLWQLLQSPVISVGTILHSVYVFWAKTWHVSRERHHSFSRNQKQWERITVTHADWYLQRGSSPILIQTGLSRDQTLEKSWVNTDSGLLCQDLLSKGPHFCGKIGKMLAY